MKACARRGGSGWHRQLTGLAIAVSVTVAAHAQRSPDAEVAFLQVPEGQVIHETIRADFDGDGRSDLLVLHGEEDGDSLWVRWYLQRSESPAFRARPEMPALQLREQVLAVAVGDVHVKPGPELIAFSATAAWVVLPTEGGADYQRLASIEFLWQGPAGTEVFGYQQGVRDLDGDGLVDLFVPEPGGYRALFQSRGEQATFERRSVMTLPQLPPKREQGPSLRGGQSDDGFEFSFTFDERERGPLLRITDRVPAPHPADWDGDGDLDVLALQRGHLLVWIQDGGFAAEPAVRLQLPQEEGKVDMAWRVVPVDVDGDRRCDIAIHTSRIVDEETRATVMVYRNLDGDPFAGKKRGDDRIRLKGILGLANYEDVDGDGLPEFIASTTSLDLIDAVRGGSVDGVINVFTNDFDQERARFRRPVAMAHAVSVSVEDFGERGNFKLRFFADIDGDGLMEIVRRTEKGVVHVEPLQRRGEGYRIGAPIYSLEIDENADVETVARSGRPEFFVLEAAQVIHVRFPR